jgi:NAD(P)-dependent dehydrogenase (short-subunit alcohol dehydrogenase family)
LSYGDSRPCDLVFVTQEAEIQNLASRVEQVFARLDVLVNNADKASNWVIYGSNPKRHPKGLIEDRMTDFMGAMDVN